MPTKTGVCINYGGNCTKAKNKELQEAEMNNFICSECQQPLLEKQGGNKRRRPKNKRWLILASVIVIGIIAVFLIFAGGNNKNKLPRKPDSTIVDSINNDRQIVPSTDQDSVAEAKVKLPEPKPKRQFTYIDLGYARYEGPIVSGKPHGVGGELTITGYHVFDLKDGNGSTIEVNAGDMIKNCKFKNGKFVQGFLHRRDGTQTVINIGI